MFVRKLTNVWNDVLYHAHARDHDRDHAHGHDHVRALDHDLTTDNVPHNSHVSKALHHQHHRLLVLVFFLHEPIDWNYRLCNGHLHWDVRVLDFSIDRGSCWIDKNWLLNSLLTKYMYRFFVFGHITVVYLKSINFNFQTCAHFKYQNCMYLTYSKKKCFIMEFLYFITKLAGHKLLR